VVATGDKAAGADVIRSMAERAGATITEADGSHVIMVSQPETVANVILTAAAAVHRPSIVTHWHLRRVLKLSLSIPVEPITQHTTPMHKPDGRLQVADDTVPGPRSVAMDMRRAGPQLAVILDGGFGPDHDQLLSTRPPESE
jgi:hypothetical protein